MSRKKICLNMWLDSVRKRQRYSFEETVSMAEYSDDVAYWENVPMIHNWFVLNVQQGQDDGRQYMVSKKHIKQLYDICREVYNKTYLKTQGTIIKNVYIDNEIVPIAEPKRVISNPRHAIKLLPIPKDWLNIYNYDIRYYNEVKYTIDVCANILEHFDFNRYYLIYGSNIEEVEIIEE